MQETGAQFAERAIEDEDGVADNSSDSESDDDDDQGVCFFFASVFSKHGHVVWMYV